jgi:hypothetical protein
MKKLSVPKRKTSGLDKYLFFSFMMIIVFTVIQTIITAVTGYEQETLITCFFSVFGGEVLLCAMIKRFKLKYPNSDEGV